MPADSSVIVRALVVVARKRGGRDFLAINHENATLAFIAGEPRIRLLNADGTQTEFDHWLSPDSAVEILQLALEAWDAQDPDAAFDSSSPGVLTPRITNIPL